MLNYIVLEEDSLVVITLPEKITIPDVVYSEEYNPQDENDTQDENEDEDPNAEIATRRLPVVVSTESFEQPYENSIEQPVNDEYESDWDTPLPIFDE